MWRSRRIIFDLFLTIVLQLLVSSCLSIPLNGTETQGMSYLFEVSETKFPLNLATGFVPALASWLARHASIRRVRGKNKAGNRLSLFRKSDLVVF